MLRHAYYLPEPEYAVELCAFTHGLMPRTVPMMMQHFVDDWRTRGVDAWNEVPNHWLPESGERVGWWTLPTYLADRFVAPLIGAVGGTSILQPNVHWTIQCLLSSRELFAKRKRVVTTAAEFPSVRFSVRQWAGVLGYTLQEIPLLDGRVDEEAVLDAIDDDTALVLLSHVGFTTGALLGDGFIRAAGDRVHEAGGLLALDGYHALGTATTPVSDLPIDVYVGGLLKEGSGASGNAFVYIRPGLVLTPRTTGWFGDARPFEFEDRPQPHGSVRMRFLGGTTAVAPMYHAVEGARLLLQAGMERVRVDSLEKTRYCIERADGIGLTLRSPRRPEARSAMLIFEIPHADLLVQYLKTRHIYTDSRQGIYLRMAPFVWNTGEELERTFDVLANALSSGAYLERIRPDESGPVT